MNSIINIGFRQRNPNQTEITNQKEDLSINFK